MALSSTYTVLWLDAHIALPAVCNDLKTSFQLSLAPAAVAAPVDPIKRMICDIEEFAAPVSFASTVEQALESIDRLASDGKKVILITSASLGKIIMLQIKELELAVYWYYIFCGNMESNVEWALDYVNDGLEIQMFDFETTLLVRLTRDLSKELIEEGKKLLNNDPHSALRYFECARDLAENAVKRDTPKDPTDPHRPSTTHRKELNGENGLIAQAKRACDQHAS